MFHLRVRVPNHLRARVGMLEVRRSLHVYDHRTARLLAPKYTARVLGLFEMVETKEIPTTQIQAMVRDLFRDLRPMAEKPMIFRSQRPDLEREEQWEFAAEAIEKFTQELESQEFNALTERRALALLHRAGIEPSLVDETSMHRLKVGVVRAKRERAALAQFRLTDELSDYAPRDPLFEEADSAPPASPYTSAPMAVGPTVEFLIETYLTSGGADWVPKTVESKRRQLRLLKEHLGAETVLSTVNAADMRAYRDGVRRLRKTDRLSAKLSFQQRQTPNAAGRISDKTAALTLEAAKTFLGWAFQESYIGANPAESIKLKTGKKAKSKDPRRPFNAEELKLVFQSPTFTGRAGRQQFNTPGDHLNSDAYYWIPLVGHFTGMRLGEIVQAHLSDIKSDGPVHYIDVTEVGDVEDPDTMKYVKSEAGIRKVPLHPHLIELGFLKFVERRRKQRKDAGRLFFEVGYGADGMPSSRFSKWFGRIIRKAGVTSKAVVFHSFRHNAKDALRNANAKEYVIDRIIGHEEVATASYGHGASLETCYDAVCEMKFAVDVRELVKRVE